MRVTPLDIIQKDFTLQRRGFDPEEVKLFLEEVRETLEETLKESRRLQERVRELEAEVEHLRSTESDIAETLTLARKLSDELADQARREADLVIGEARLEAQQIISASHDEHRELLQEIHRLKSQKHKFAAEMRALIEIHLRLLDEAEDR